MSKKKPYCLMPWIHLHIGDHGMAKACCVANIPFGNINEKSFEEIWNGEAINELRDKFAKEEKDNRCAQCYKLEDAGGKSIRQETFEKFPHIEIEKDTPILPIYFDIRFSNVCNFRCRTCWHGASSKWFSDAKILGRNIGEKAIIKNIQDFNSFIEKTGKALLKAEEIYFAGGEPLVTEEHYLLLNWLIENKATQMRLRYNTNFSKLKFREYDVIELWKNFPKVEVLGSIDATEDLGAYIRTEFSWDLFVENREKIRSFSNINFKISPTISVLNMHHLPTLYQTAIELQLIDYQDVYFNILERPLYYNIKIFPKEKKEKIQLIFDEFFIWIEKNNIPQNIKIGFRECLDYMWAEDLSKHWGKFEKENGVLDKLRNETF